MTNKLPQSRKELEEHLADQLQFLEASAGAYDAGFTGEAKRLSVTLRILLYDRGHSKSLLGQLDMKGGLFYDTAMTGNIDSRIIMSEYTLVSKFLGKDEVRFVPLLDKYAKRHAQVDFDTWWNAIVIKDMQGNTLTRQKLVLSVADQDGGAHVDPSLDETYAKISRQNSLGVFAAVNAEWTGLLYAERASVRQIAHEVLKTLKPGYTNHLALPNDGYLISSGLMLGNEPSMPTVPVQKKIGRNEPCPCGSGLKYKKCHGQ